MDKKLQFQPAKQITQVKIPNDYYLEKTLLGQILYSGSMGYKEFDQAINLLEAGVGNASDFSNHFYNPGHKKIYEVLYLSYSKQRPISLINIASIISSEPFFQNDSASAEVYLEDLVQDACLSSQVEEISRQILDLSIKRQLIQISEKMVSDIAVDKEALSSSDFINEIEKQLANLIIHNDYNRTSQTLSELASSLENKIRSNMENKGSNLGITTGFLALDNMLCGFQNSDLVIIAARPAMGKTSFALSLALNAAESMRDNNKNGAVGFFSLEMSNDQLVTRLISMKSGVNSMKMRSGHINDDEFDRINLAVNSLRELDCVIDDNAALSITELRSRVRRMVIKNNLSILFVDYLQLLRGSKKSSDLNRVNEISEISRGLKQIAKELNIPVIALSQLSREVEKREDKIPKLSDLRESGSIEQDADIVMFIHREEYYLRRKEPRKNGDTDESDGDDEGLLDTGYHNTKKKPSYEEKMEEWQEEMDKAFGKASIIIAKHRNGPVGRVELCFDHNTTGFVDPMRYDTSLEEE